jgi:hypothetical protein
MHSSANGASRLLQRFTGEFTADGGAISGRWETSQDGSTWEHDFDLTYREVT